jgi:hypothetical protein
VEVCSGCFLRGEVRGFAEGAKREERGLIVWEWLGIERIQELLAEDRCSWITISVSASLSLSSKRLHPSRNA